MSIDVSSDSWTKPDTVRGFAQSPPNATLMRFAAEERARGQRARALDLGCGAARNAVPLARMGWHVLGIDMSVPMLRAAAVRAMDEAVGDRIHLARAGMDSIPAVSGSFDLVIAHGIWNLARTGREFRVAIAEAARVAKPGAGLFVFTFSRTTLPSEVKPVPGEEWVFTEFSGHPQCFLTADQLVRELGSAGFVSDRAVPLTEHNRPRPGALSTSGPVIYEAAFRRTA